MVSDLWWKGFTDKLSVQYRWFSVLTVLLHRPRYCSAGQTANIIVKLNNAFKVKVTDAQVIHRHQTLPRYRHDIDRRRWVQPPPSVSRPLRPNVTSSIKPEVHNVAQRRRGGPSNGNRGYAHKILCGSVQQFQRYMLAYRQTDRRTDRHTVTWAKNTTSPGQFLVSCRDMTVASGFLDF